MKAQLFTVMQPSLSGRIKYCTLSVCPSIRTSYASIRFYRYSKAIETSKLVQTERWTEVTRGENLRSKDQRGRSLGTKT